MKKIVSAAAAALILGGFAAAEAKFSVNYRTGISALSHVMGHNTKLFDANATNYVDGKTYRSTSDALSFKGSGEYGGLELEIDPLYKPAGTKAHLGNEDNLAKYNGWINFGKFMFKSGAWDARAVGRVNADMGNHEGKFWGEVNKPGLTQLGTGKKGEFAKTNGNGVDISQQNGKAKITNMLAYVDKDLGLEVRGAVIQSKETSTYANPDDSGDDWVFANQQWFAEVGYTIKDVGRVLVNTKASYKDQAFAIFVEPKLADLKALTSLVGFTFEQNYENYDKDGDPLKAYALGLDLRARYAIDEQLSVTAMLNWTTGDAVDLDAADEKKTLGTKTARYATWGMLNATYKLNETFVPFCSVIYTSGLTAGAAGAMSKSDTYASSLRVYPGVEIYNTKNANIITGIVWDVNGFMAPSGTECVKAITIPVLMRVKF